MFEGRIISATNANLKENIAKGAFREDLFFRLSMLSIAVPSLQQRVQDIPLLCEHFIAKANKDLKTSITSIAQIALLKLQKQVWRGNIRELRNTIYSACLNAQDDVLDIHDFNDLEVKDKTIEDDIHQLCQSYLEQCGIEKAKELEAIMRKELLHVGLLLCPNITKLSSALDISRNTLKKELKDFNLKYQDILI